MSKKKLEKFEEKIDKGLKLVQKRLLEFKRLKGTPLVTMKDGKVVHLKVPAQNKK